MEKSVTLFQFQQSLSDKQLKLLDELHRDDVCFFRFIGGNSGDTEKLIDQLSALREKGVLLFGIFRFPFRFEGKRRLQTAIVQYFEMKERCDGITYYFSDGMMETLVPHISIQAANQAFDEMELMPVKALENMLQHPGTVNIDVQDVFTFVRSHKGPVFVRTIEGDSFDEPLKYSVSAPYLAQDYMDGKQMMINIGYGQQVNMESFRQISLRLNDLFNKADLFKLGTYHIDEPTERFKITMMVNGLSDPFERPETMHWTSQSRTWIKRKWNKLAKNRSLTKAPILFMQKRRDEGVQGE